MGKIYQEKQLNASHIYKCEVNIIIIATLGRNHNLSTLARINTYTIIIPYH
jgi:hypothetical protein